jgi:hypothetical protein
MLRFVQYASAIKDNKILPPKEAEATPGDKLCADLIGPYKIRRNALFQKGRPFVSS